MKLEYIWIEEYKNLKNAEFNFSEDYDIKFDKTSEKLTIRENKINVFWGQNINSVNAIIGNNGSGKTTLFEFISKYIYGNLKKTTDNELHCDEKYNVRFVVSDVSQDEQNKNIFHCNLMKSSIDSRHKESVEYIYVDFSRISSIISKNNGALFYLDNNTYKEKFELLPSEDGVHMVNCFSNNCSVTRVRDKNIHINQDFNNLFVLRNDLFGENTFFGENEMLESFSLDSIGVKPKSKYGANEFTIELGALSFEEELSDLFKEHNDVLLVSTKVEKPYGPPKRKDLNKVSFENRSYIVEYNEEIDVFGLVARAYIKLSINEFFTREFNMIERSLLNRSFAILNHHLRQSILSGAVTRVGRGLSLLGNLKDNREASLAKILECVKSVFLELKVDTSYSSVVPNTEVYVDIAGKIKIDHNGRYMLRDSEIKFIYNANNVMSGIATEFSEIFDFIELDKNGTEINISTGERYVRSLFASIHGVVKYSDFKYITIYIDEADEALHPLWSKNFIKTIIDFVNMVSNGVKVNIVLTSHSPLLLSDIPARNVAFIKEGATSKLESESFGQNIHTLYADVFGIKDGLIGEFAKQKINDTIKWLNKKEDKEDVGKNHINLINTIGEPVIKNKLLRMYDKKLDSNHLSNYQNSDEFKIKKLESERQYLESQLKIIDDEINELNK